MFVIPQGGVDNARKGLQGDILSACTQNLAKFKAPHEVRLMDEFPRSTLNKVSKAVLRSLLAPTAAG